MTAKERSVIILVSIVLFGAILVLNVYLDERNQKNIVEYGEMESASENATLYNIWLVEGKEKEITALVDKTLCTFPLKKKTTMKLGGVVADLKLKNGVVEKITIKEDTIEGKVLSVTEDTIEVEQYGELPIGKGFKVYKTYGEEVAKGAEDAGESSKAITVPYDQVEQAERENIVVGYDNTAFVVADGKICAGLILKPAEIKNIRVLIKNTDYSSEYHQQVIFTANKDFTVRYGKTKKEYKKGEKVTIDTRNDIFHKNKYLKVVLNKGGKVSLLSVKRNGKNPGYQGTIEIRKKNKGLVIINEIELEKYLYGVIGSEMPISYGQEALKVQAICARSYAYKQFMYNDCGSLGAHVDDSVSYQVYNNTPECKETMQAVDDTKGMVMVSDGEIITSYYFSTSCGHTASAQDVWQGGVQGEYLTGRVQNDSKKNLHLEKEKNFEKFILNKEFDSFDKEFSWYRWEVTLTKEQITSSVNQNLAERYKKNKDLILTKKKDGTYKSRAISTVGDVKSIRALERGTGGVIKALEIKGSSATIKVLSEYNVRLLLTPSSSTIYRADKSKIEGMSMLPSGFFIIKEENKKSNISFHLYGGGYGHGVGMSQNGAKVMAEKGYSYKEILTHYYPGVSLQLGM
ncbi:MAG: SpoIID/LytB domain-containing protein [Lachnospiraceae bacterium]|nr:SpoIID/LytB domain-containing protein [Lachnospiraceae bacterium]